MFAIGRTLIAAGVSPRHAKTAVGELLNGGQGYVEAHASTQLARDLGSLGVTLARIEIHHVDVKALRERLGMSQEAFAGRYGLDVATLRNWEQGRTTPEGPAATLLHLIERDPEAIGKMMAR